MQADHQQNLSAQLIYYKISEMLQHCKVKQPSLDKLPQSFKEFLKERGIQIKQLTAIIPRYIRIKPNHQIGVLELVEKLGITKEEIVQIQSHFWALNPIVKINHCQLYQDSILYGMDYSSSIPVKCLSVKPKQRVLELCCAPGNKSMLMADLNPDIHITGVEISINRANIMKNLVTKYKLNKQIEVIIDDGLTYSNEQPFDRVLIDAECTHEGSLKHIYKFMKDEGQPELKVNKKLSKQQEKQFKVNNSNPYTSQITTNNKWSKEDFESRFLDNKKLTEMKHLQYGLLTNGFKLLKKDGILVYSTCSFDHSQNELIIQEFIDKNEDAELIDAGTTLECGVRWKEGTLKGTIRLSPVVSACGGMFVAKLRRK